MTFEDRSTGDSYAGRSSSITLGDVFVFLRKYWVLIVLMAIGSFLAGLIAVSLIPRSYTATAQVIYDPTSSPMLSSNSRWLEPSTAITMRMESQVEVIQSATIAEDVVRRLDLAEDTEFQRQEPWYWRWLSADFRNLIVVPEEGPPQQAPSEQLLIDQAVQPFLSKLSGQRVGRSTTIALSFRSRDPVKAVRIANMTADSYVRFDIKQKSVALKQGNAWLTERLKYLRKQSFDAAREVELFKRSGGGSATDAAVQLAELESIAQTYRRLYESVLLQLTDSLQKVSYPVADVRILSYASVSRVRVYPRTTLLAIFIGVLGGFVGLAIGLVRETSAGAQARGGTKPAISEVASGRVEPVEVEAEPDVETEAVRLQA